MTVMTAKQKFKNKSSNTSCLKSSRQNYAEMLKEQDNKISTNTICFYPYKLP
jgi:hypothetical protein